MAAELRTDETLFKAIVPLLLETTTYLTSDTQRAVDARNNVEPGFHARIHQDLGDIALRLEELGYNTLRQADHWILRTLEDHFVTDTEEEGSEGPDETQDFPHIWLLVDRAQEREALSKEERIIWLLGQFELESPKKKHQRRLTKDLSRLLESTGGSEEALELGSQDGARSTSEWDGAEATFEGMQRIHEVLAEHMHHGCPNCVCLLGRSKLSFPKPSTANQSFLSCTLIRPMGHGQALQWYSLDIKTNASERMSSVKFADIPDTAGQMRSQGTSTDSLAVCDLSLGNSTGKTFTVEQKRLFRESLMQSVDSNVARAPFPPVQLTDWIHCPLPPSLPDFSTVPLKARLRFALYLAYAFLHLSGGLIWPNDRVFTDFWFFRGSSSDASALANPFISVAPDDDDFNSVEVNMPRILNGSMPSLAVLGKLFLELFTGEKLSWDSLDSHLEKCNEPLQGYKLASVALACIREEDFRRAGRTIRNDDELRKKFLSDVVLKLQKVVVDGYNIQPSALFQNPLATAERPRHRGIASAAIRRARTASASFLLYDEHNTRAQVDEEEANATRSWFEQFRYRVLPFSASNSRQPVKVALIDTGVHVDSDTRTAEFGRVVECRTWVPTTIGGTSPSEGSKFEGFDQDDDGHGTHGTALLLQITEHLDTEIFVAKVFRHRNQDRGSEEDEALQQSIAKAIDYAVQQWGVDIISMAFGFPQKVDVIEAAIRRAARGDVLMFAAASNVAGNAERRWPARHHNVICVHAADGYGNSYDYNPSPHKTKDNLAFLGTCIPSYWPPGIDGISRKVYKSGTSTATPIAVGIAATILDFAQRNKGSKDEPRYAWLRTATGMRSIMKLMVTGERGGYHYVCPWKLFDGNVAERQNGILQQIWNEIDKLRG